MIKKLSSKISKLSLASQIALMALLLSILFPLISGIINQFVYQDIFMNQSYDALKQTMVLVENNIDNTIGLIDETSQALIASQDVSDTLDYKSFTVDVERNNGARMFIRNVLDNTSYASSVHLFNNYGSVMNIGISMINYPVMDNIKLADWYSDIKELEGQYKLITNGGNFFVSESEQNFISMARIYNDIYVQKEKGVLVINVSSDSIANSFKKLATEYDTKIVILDELNQVVVSDSSIGNPISLLDEIENSKAGYYILRENEKEYMTEYIINDHGWKIIGALDTSELTDSLKQTSFLNYLFFILTGIFIFIAISIIVKYKTDVFNEIIDVMNDTSTGRLEHAHVKESSRDIKDLQDGYNDMVDEINTLIETIKSEEESKSALEFSMLQSQIKPHFLYNTFDSISSLALMGENKLVYEASMALGNFYRTSLSRGKEIISLEEEVNAIKSYLKILSIRYSDTFDVTWDIDGDVKHVLVPKLLLQPFVENAIYHGIRPKGTRGHLRISIETDGNMTRIVISDDGLGMEEVTLTGILNEAGGGFGVTSTIQRLKLYFKDRAHIDIVSALDEGTTVILEIPML